MKTLLELESRNNEAGNLVCYLSEENSKVAKACRRLYGDRGWQPDVTQNPLWLFSDRPRPLRDALHVEARDPLHVAGREAVQVERQAQRPTLRRKQIIVVAHRNMTRVSVANRVPTWSI